MALEWVVEERCIDSLSEHSVTILAWVWMRVGHQVAPLPPPQWEMPEDRLQPGDSFRRVASFSVLALVRRTSNCDGSQLTRCMQHCCRNGAPNRR